MVVKHRHWIRGILGGLIFGLGLGVGSIVYGITTFGAMTPWVAVVLGLVLGIVLIFVPAIRKGRKPKPPAWAQSSSTWPPS